jgi:transposase
MPPGLATALGPVLQQIAEMTLKIKHYDQQIRLLTQTEYPEAQTLLTVQGVGPITALTFVLTLGSKERFGRSRDVGCYLNACPANCFSPNKSFCCNQLEELVPQCPWGARLGAHGLAGVE